MIVIIKKIIKKILFEKFSALDRKAILYPESIDVLLNYKIVCTITPGRSGTATFIDITRKITDEYAIHSPLLTNQVVSYLYSQKKLPKDSAFWAYFTSRERYLLRAFSNDKVFIDGDCKYLPFVNEIAQNMKNSKFIHFVRDPRKFIRSGLERGYFEEKPAEYWGYISPDNNLNYSQIEKIAYFWNEANVIAEKMKAKYGADRVLTIKAEDMFSSISVVAEILQKFNITVEEMDNIKPKKLNGQKKSKLSNSQVDEIENAVIRICNTRFNYDYN